MPLPCLSTLHLCSLDRGVGRDELCGSSAAAGVALRRGGCPRALLSPSSQDAAHGRQEPEAAPHGGSGAPRAPTASPGPGTVPAAAPLPGTRGRMALRSIKPENARGRQRRAGDAASAARRAAAGVAVGAAAAAAPAPTGRQPPGTCCQSSNTKCCIQEHPDAEISSPLPSLNNQNVTVVPAPHQPPSNANQPKDFLRCLPSHLAMSILGLLDQKSLKACAAVNRFWAFLARAVEKERVCQSMVQEKIQYLQGLCPRGAVPNYAKVVKVIIPQLGEEGEVTPVKDNDSESQVKVGWKEEEDNLQAAYHDIKTDTVQLEERNVFCSCYNIRVLLQQTDRSRVIHYDGGHLVAIGSADRQVRLFDMSEMREVPPLLSGHAGSIKALFLQEKKGFLLSTGYDLSIRYWDLQSGDCLKIFYGHRMTVTCLDLHGEHFVSGARDGTLKVWNLALGKCLRTLRHGSPVLAAKMGGQHIISGGERGMVKVWNADTGALIKTLQGHQGPVKCLTFDQWHLVTGSSDGYVMGWSMLGKLKRCLIAFRHPKEVLSLEFLYLRVISGCADGKIRVFNYLTGSCLKVLTASGGGDPVCSFCVAEGRMVINTPSSLLLYEFEEVWWDYTLGTDREMGKNKKCLGNYRAKWLQLQQSQDGLDQLHRLTGETQGAKPKHDVWVSKDAARPEAAWKQQKRKNSSCSISPYKFLLTVSMLQKTRKAAQGSPGVKNTARGRESGKLSEQSSLVSPWKSPRKASLGSPWRLPREHQHHRPGEEWSHKTSLLSRRDQAAQLQPVKPHSGSSTVTRFSVPFETKMLQLKLEHSLYGPAVKSSIPPPSVVRPKTCGLLRGEKAPSEQSDVSPLPEDEAELNDPFMASSKLIKSTRVIMAQMPNEATSRRKSVFCPCAGDLSHSSCEFRLLTGKQEEENVAAAAAEYQAHQAKLREDQQRARRRAWLRKVKGLPTDSFTGEGKTAAPELGSKTFN
ncbi:F-box and WD repeat domain containing protein 10B [Pogoniulus pusillus]|uniref:F-box and WD repeat domain containing protein 10B n=1 Tax=Pogoniulus pusillus TaxID=488313 RepID=UPI0030B978DB